MKPNDLLFLIYLLFIMLTFSFGQTKAEPASHLNIDKETLIAVSGYDLVSYFEKPTPVKGNPKWRATYDGAHYHFSSENHRNLFLKNPQKYLPIYGGWCAYAIGKYGQKVSIDPKSYLIIKDTLYLFYNSLLNDTKKKWIDDSLNLKVKATAHWNKIIDP